MMSTVIGGAMLPHVPQFFTMPETAAAAEIGKAAWQGRQLMPRRRHAQTRSHCCET